MNLPNLPTELFEKIATLLDNKSLLALSECSKDINYKIKLDSFIWKKKALLEYSKSIRECSCKYSYKCGYIRLYTTLCIGCSKKTTVIHPFRKERICGKCQKKHWIYTTVSLSTVKKRFPLNDKDLYGVEYYKKHNQFNAERPMKKFLLSDILAVIIKKFGSYNNMLDHKKILEAKKNRKRLLYHTRFTILRATLLVKHDIEILSFARYLNSYSNGLFTRYIHNISKKQNFALADTVVNLCIEMEFLRIHGIEPDESNRDDFHRILRFMMLSDSVIDMEYPHHIDRWKVEVLDRYSQQFERKQLLVTKLQGLDFSLTDTKQICYIEFGIGDLEDIRLDIIEENFMITNFDFFLMSRDFISSSGTKRERYAKCIRRHLLDGGQIPEELKVRYTEFL